jgi:peptide/nickel transport system permease protein
LRRQEESRGAFEEAIMTTFIIRRLLQSIAVLFLVSLLVFFGMRLLPGDPIRMLVTAESYTRMTPEEVELLRHENGLDKPLVEQYGTWIGGVLKGDWGRSILSKGPVLTDLKHRIPITLHIGLLSLIIGLIVGVAVGILSAVRRNSWLDTLVTVLANVGITIPTFLVALFGVYLFSIKLGWLPVMGYTSPFTNFWLNTKQIIMPVLCLATFPIAGFARQTRTSMLEVMNQDYVRTAWSKGLSERVIIVRHALKNSLAPVMTMAGMQLGGILGGSVIVETVFVIPGMGFMALHGIMQQDYPSVQGVVLVVAIAVVLANLLVDISYGWFDPRIRYR